MAEAKFLARPGEYAPLIRRGDREGLMALLTDQRVEALVRRTRSPGPATPCGRLRSACWCTLCQRAMWGMRLVQEPVQEILVLNIHRRGLLLVGPCEGGAHGGEGSRSATTRRSAAGDVWGSGARVWQVV